MEEAGGEVAEAHMRLGSPAEEILHVSEKIMAGLIVVGNQGFGPDASPREKAEAGEAFLGRLHCTFGKKHTS